LNNSLFPDKDVGVFLSIIIPAYNEASRISFVLDSIGQYIASQAPVKMEDKCEKTEVIVVCDGSSDNTADLVSQRQKNDTWLKLISYQDNKGKGYAVRTGMKTSRGEIAVFMDADGSTPISELDKFISLIKSGVADIVIGSRRMRDSHISIRQPFFRWWLGRAFSIHNRFVLGIPFLDTQCGFKVFRGDRAREIFSETHCDGFAFDLEILLIAREKKMIVLEKGVEWKDDRHSKVSPIKDGLRMLKAAWELRFSRIPR
jgi:glycosyltransferase involved in cell wall biosynthesis